MTAPAILGPTIEHLRAYCPPFGGRVAGAAEFSQGLKNYSENMAHTLTFPVAYVVPSNQESEHGNENLIGYWQIVRKTIAIIVELDASPDRRGQAPAMLYDQIEAALFAALLNWAPVECRVPNGQGYQFVSGSPLDLDRARLFYSWEFALPYQLTELDGWQAPDGDPDGDGSDGPIPLTEIDLYIFDKPGATAIEQPPDEPAAVVKIITDPPQPIPQEDLAP